MSTNNDAYAAAFAEIEEGRLDKGAWARAFAESGGDESKAKALYIKARVEMINALPAWSDTQPPVQDIPRKRIDPKTSDGRDSQTSHPVEYYEVALGDKNADYYLDKFLAFDRNGTGLHASWNWAAFFFTGFWALYRKMYGWFFAWWAVSTVVTIFSKVPNAQLQQGLGIVVLAFWLGFSTLANSVYHRKIKARIAVAQKSTDDTSRVTRRLASGAGVSTWVTYIFGAIPIIGIVAAVALPAYQDYAKRRTVATASTNEIDGFLDGKLISPPVPPPAPSPERQVNWDKGVIAPLVQAERGPWEDYQYQDAVAARTRGDFASALPIFRSLAERGYARAQGDLGVMYNLGHGVKQDYLESVKWYRLAAAQGNFNAQSNLGIMLMLGQGVPKDYIRGHMWLNLALTSGDEDAQKAKDSAEVLMTPQQIKQAQQMARDCQQRNFKGCD